MDAVDHGLHGLDASFSCLPHQLLSGRSPAYKLHRGEISTRQRLVCQLEILLGRIKRAMPHQSLEMHSVDVCVGKTSSVGVAQAVNIDVAEPQLLTPGIKRVLDRPD